MKVGMFLIFELGFQFLNYRDFYFCNNLSNLGRDVFFLFYRYFFILVKKVFIIICLFLYKLVFFI